MSRFLAHGKLLITGEYLVLEGARALAVPLTLGQVLDVEEVGSGLIEWDATHADGPWFSVKLSLSELFPIQYSKGAEPESYRLAAVMRSIMTMNPKFFSAFHGLRMKTHLDFPPDWGLGSSSTLISLLAQWSQVDAYQLLSMTFKGSGYDIACATAQTPIIYKLAEGPVWQPTTLAEAFDQSVLVYSGRKQDSRSAMREFNKRGEKKEFRDEVDDMAQSFAEARDAEHLMSLMKRHEEILSQVLDKEPIQRTHYTDFDGQTKSLGAWGGDFFLALSKRGSEYTKDYFKLKGLKVMFSPSELFLGSKQRDK